MATQTTNLLLNKPTVGADSDIWGGLLNDNADILEVAVLDKRTGGSITGDVSIAGNLSVTTQISVATLVATGAISADTVSATTSMTAPTFNGALNGNANTASTLQTARTISLSGDVSGSTSFNGGANVNISATIQQNSVALGTDTTGNYVESVAAGGGITVAGADGEGVTKTVSHADTSAQASVNNAGNTFIQDVTLDGFGHVTGLVSATAVINDGTLTVQGGTAINGSGSFTANQAGNTTITLSHADTSGQGSVNNAGGTVIQDVTLDGFGHVTGLGSVNLDGRYSADRANSNINVVGAYILAFNTVADISQGGTTAGSNLVYSAGDTANQGVRVNVGTWRVHGFGAINRASVYQRIS